MATEIQTGDDNQSIGEINKYDFQTDTEAVFKARKGIDREIVEQILSLIHISEPTRPY